MLEKEHQDPENPTTSAGEEIRSVSNTPTQIPFFEALASTVSLAGIRNIALVPGSGIDTLAAHLEEKGRISVSVAPNELAAVGYVIGNMRCLKAERAAFAGTQSVGVAQQADFAESLSRGHRLPIVGIVGDSEATGPTNFQPVDIHARYGGIFGNGNIFKFVPPENGEDPSYIGSQLHNLGLALEKTYVEGEPLLISVPKNMIGYTVPDEYIASLPVMGSSRPQTLSADAEVQLNELARAVNTEGSRVLFVLGEGLGHAIRLEGKGVHGLAGKVLDKIVGNRVTTTEWADLLHGHPHEFPPASHLFDKDIQEGIETSTVVVFLGCGPNATLTGLKKGLGHYANGSTRCFMIDPSAASLQKWQDDSNLKNADSTYIQAPIKQALESLHTKEWEHIHTRTLAAKDAATRVRKAIFDTERKTASAQEMQTISEAIVKQLESAEESGMKIGLCVSSGYASIHAGLRYKTRAIKPGSLFYPNEAMLGAVLSAAHGMADAGEHDAVVALLGDGEGGYTPWEFGYLQRANCPVICIVFNNGKWKGIEADNSNSANPIERNIQRYRQTIHSSFVGMASVFPDANIAAFAVEGNDQDAITTAITNALNHKGPSIIEINMRDIRRSQDVNRGGMVK